MMHPNQELQCCLCTSDEMMFPSLICNMYFPYTGATANAAKEHMLPFFNAVMEQLKVYLTSNIHQDTGDTLILQIQSIGLFVCVSVCSVIPFENTPNNSSATNLCYSLSDFQLTVKSWKFMTTLHA